MNKEETLELVYGDVRELLLPSGFTVRIREQNGNDDDILSNKATSRDLTNINIFLASLIIWTDLPFAVNNRITAEQVKNMLLRDKYFIIFASRQHSVGDDVSFEYDWGKENGGKFKYTEHLSNYVKDFTKPIPKEGEEGYFPYTIKPYDVDEPYKKLETIIGSKKLRFNLMDGHSEQYLLGLTIEQNTLNAEIKSRNLEILINESWHKVDNFQSFTKKEMASLRNYIYKLDPEFQGLTDLENPQTHQKISYPLIAAPDFFYPQEI